MKMDMSHFKKVKEDNESAVLKHPKGHEIRVAKKGLSKKLMSDLQNLPIHMDEGGQIPPVKELDPSSPAPIQDQNPQSAQQAYEAAKSRLEQQPSIVNPFDPSGTMYVQKEDPNYNLALEKSALEEAKQFNYSKREEADSQRRELNKTQALISQYKNAGVEPPKQLVDKQVEMSQIPGVQKPLPTNYTPASLQLGDGAQAQPQQQSPQMPNYMASAIMPAINYEHGMMAEANAAQRQGNAIAMAAKQQQADMNAAKQWYQNRYEQLDKERMDLRQDISRSHIDPNRYIRNMSAGSKVINAFAMILGGMGAALTHGQNPAYEFLKNSIDNDVNSQKFELDKKNNLLSENLRAFGNLKDASDMTRLMTGEMYLAKMRQSEGEAMGPLAKARMQQAAAKFEMEYVIPLQQQMAMRQGLMSGSAQGQVRPEMLIMYSGMVPKEQQGEALKQLKEMQDMQSTRDHAIETMRKVFQLNTVANRLGNPQQSKQQIAGLLAPLKLEIPRMLAGKVSDVEIHKIEDALNNFWDNQDTLNSKISNLEAVFNNQMNYPLLRLAGVQTQSQARPAPMPMQISNPGAYQQVGYKPKR